MENVEPVDMDEFVERIGEENRIKIAEEKKEKKWDHIPCRPETFQEFKELKEEIGCKSCDALVKELIKSFRGL